MANNELKQKGNRLELATVFFSALSAISLYTTAILSYFEAKVLLLGTLTSLGLYTLGIVSYCLLDKQKKKIISP